MTHHDALSRACRELLHHADCLHVLTLAPLDALPAARMQGLLVDRLTALHECFVDRLRSDAHRRHLASVIAERPDVEAQVRELTRHRSRMKARLTRLISQAARAGSLTRLSADIADLVELLDVHGSREREFVACLESPSPDGSVDPSASRVRALSPAFDAAPVSKTG